MTCWIEQSADGPGIYALCVVTGCGRSEVVDLASLLATFLCGVPSHSYRLELITCARCLARLEGKRHELETAGSHR